MPHLSRALARCWLLTPLLLSGFLISGCETPNTSPSAQLIAPTGGTPLKPGSITLEGKVADLETDASMLSASFSISTLTGGTVTSCNAIPDATGLVSCTLTFSNEGDYVVGLYVADTEGLQGSAEIQVTFANQKPTLEIESPADSALDYSERTPVTVVGKVTDPDDTQLLCALSSDLSGALGTASVDTSTGRCSISVTLSRGVHVLTMTATDPGGKEGKDSISLPIKSCTDLDADGKSLECDGDCNDSDATVYPGAPELCDRKDNNCDGTVDNAPDADADTFTECTGDCDDARPDVNPLQFETCDGVDNNCVLGTDEGYDTDRDGYNDLSRCPETGTDCDDFDNTINPGAAEICDTFDNNCNGLVDDGAQSIYFYDVDGDSYGDPLNTISACAAPLGTVTNAGDCNDTLASINPSSLEACNGLDDDCDGALDEDTTPKTFYPDSDGDGYGVSGGATQSGCVTPLGYAELAGDCNDTDASIFPTNPEVCDSKDNDCDAQVDEGVIKTYYKDVDQDGYGIDSDKKTGCSAPTGYASQGGDCKDDNAAINPGAVEQCDGLDNNCNSQIDDNVTTQTYYKDSDNDKYGDTNTTKVACSQPTGYCPVPGDCNDARADINPGVPELCDGLDNNCSGLTDEGVKNTYYRDADGDGYGNPNNPGTGCTAPSGYVVNKTDCNDNSNKVYPGATELCDGLDNDCDNTLDEGLTAKTFYKDADNDTYGGTTTTVSACAAPPGFSASNTDCNDSNNTTYPGAPETCDGEDDDCDGTKDEGTECFDDDKDGYTEKQGDCNDANASINPGASEPTTPDGVDNNCNSIIDDKTVCWDDDKDGFIENASATSCPGYSKGAYGSTIPGGNDCNDAVATIYPGAPERFNGKDDNCDGTIDGDISLNNHTVIFTGDLKNGRLGYSVAGLGDVNGDGFGDLGIGAPQRDTLGQNRGSAFLVLGRSSGWSNQTITSVGLALDDDTAESKAGWAVAAAGDVDRDGKDDFIVGAPYRTVNPGGLSNAGRMYLLYGRTSWSNGALPSLAEAVAEGIQSNVLLGYSLTGGGDLNGDGFDDLGLGGPWPTGTARGYLMVLPGKSTRYSRTIAVSDLFKVDGGNGDALGTAMALMPDANGDGLADMLVAGYGSITTPPNQKTNPGVTYFLPGSSKFTPTQSTSLEGLGAIAWRGDTNDELIGYSVANAGDVNGDGLSDFLIGRGLQSTTTQGQAYLVLGGIIPPAGNPQSAADAWFLGDSYGCPCSVAGVGDINGDTFDDVAIGVTKSDMGGTDSGAVYLFYGAETGFAGALDLNAADVVFYGSAGEQAGIGLGGGVDVNKDGFDDLVIGSPLYDAGSNTDAGRVFVFFGFGG